MWFWMSRPSRHQSPPEEKLTRFTSPIDNRLDRDTYFTVCWPNEQELERMDVLQVFEQGDRAVILYELTSGGKRVRNCEMHTARDGQLISTEVFFGWELPHRVAEGQHKTSAGKLN